MLLADETSHISSISGSSSGLSPRPLACKGRVLVVDDEIALLRAYSRVLVRDGYEVKCATDGVRAREAVEGERFDVILSDVCMPGMSGLDLLRTVRKTDLDVPVILVSGAPTDEVAGNAAESGALLYLVKPIELRSLLQVVDHAVRLHRMAKLKRDACAHLGATSRHMGDRIGLEVCFANALSSLWIAYQPIVRWDRGEVFGYEALMRNDEPTLRNPVAFLEAAERLGRTSEIGRAVRARVAASVGQAPPGARIFVNLHTRDLADPELLSPEAPLSRVADRIVLEITERAPLDEVKDVGAHVATLRRMGFRIAVDDLGAGYAGLTAFAQLKPEVVKLDMSLIRDVHCEPVKRKLIGAMTSLCKEMGMLVVAEGVETALERDAIARIGCDSMQGYLFAKPGRGFPTVTW